MRFGMHVAHVHTGIFNLLGINRLSRVFGIQILETALLFKMLNVLCGQQNVGSANPPGRKHCSRFRQARTTGDILVAPCLPSQPDVESLAEFDELVGEAAAPTPKAQPSNAPRQAAPKEQLTERIKFKLTPAELKKLQDTIGLVPVSKWMRHYLKEQGVI